MKTWMNNTLQVLKDIYVVLTELKMLLQEHIQNKPQPMLNKFQVMEKLGISDSTYRRYVKEGRLKPMSPHGIDFYHPADLLQELRESRRKGRV